MLKETTETIKSNKLEMEPLEYNYTTTFTITDSETAENFWNYTSTELPYTITYTVYDSDSTKGDKNE